jgi:hypothetical protein
MCNAEVPGNKSLIRSIDLYVGIVCTLAEIASLWRQLASSRQAAKYRL